MKKFSEMTDEEFKNLNPFIKKSCGHCGWLVAAITLWCSNKEAVKARRTNFPGICNCPYWKPGMGLEKIYKTKKEKQTNHEKIKIIPVRRAVQL